MRRRQSAKWCTKTRWRSSGNVPAGRNGTKKVSRTVAKAQSRQDRNRRLTRTIALSSSLCALASLRELLVYFLGIETSCDETAAAVFTDELRVLSNVIASQIELHTPFGGVVPEVAARAHLQRLIPVIDEALSKSG